jgi:hypothetical protein
LGGSATGGSDYSSAGTSVTIPAGPEFGPDSEAEESLAKTATFDKPVSLSAIVIDALLEDETSAEGRTATFSLTSASALS